MTVYRNEIQDYLDDSLYGLYCVFLKCQGYVEGMIKGIFITGYRTQKIWLLRRFVEYATEDQKYVLAQVRELQYICVYA